VCPIKDIRIILLWVANFGQGQVGPGTWTFGQRARHPKAMQDQVPGHQRGHSKAGQGQVPGH
jgi:hypothetical protein